MTGLRWDMPKSLMWSRFSGCFNSTWLPHTVRRICGKQKIADFLTEAEGICRIISNPPPKSIF